MSKQGKERIFRMKQFNINHSKSANKVGVDGVLVGAWASVENASKILDAGCGCGLITLMLAQRAPDAKIIGIDIEPAAVEEAGENTLNSPWPDRIRIESMDFGEVKEKFDLMVSNPPFFHAGVANPETCSRTLARHAGGLSPERLLERAQEILTPKGKVAFIAQADSEESLLRLAQENGLYLHRLLRVRGNNSAPQKRVLFEFGLKPSDIPPIVQELTIEISPGKYTEEYINLCFDFYTIF